MQSQGKAPHAPKTYASDLLSAAPSFTSSWSFTGCFCAIVGFSCAGDHAEQRGQ
eukprot:COSAG06_NODE_45961_length_350_cov_7.792829_1_plen_53_part_01